MNNEYDEKFSIGCIYFDELFEERKMDKINLPKIGEVYVEIYDNEGDYIPHCHIHTKDNKFDCCICLDRPMYFKHGSHKSEMNSKQLKIFDDFMLENNKKVYRSTGEIKSNWKACIEAWIYASDITYKFPKNQPDYTKTKESIHA